MFKAFWMFLTMLLALPAFGEKYSFGLVMPPDWKAKANFVSAKPALKRVALPDAFDWRTLKTLSPIKNQGNCGSCWAFSSASTFRDAQIVQAGEAGDAAEQFLLDCNTKGYGCDGGYFSINDMFLSPGSVHEAQYPYQGKQGQCKPTTSYSTIKSWAFVPTDSAGNPSVEEIKAAIYAYGPVSVGVAASDFSNYKSGIFCGTATQLNHAVQLVGWGTDHWILRNSWGTGWGEQGFMRIGYKCNQVGEAANYMVYASAVPPGPPGPDPTPQPTPPCKLPTASTGYAASINSRAGARLLMGKPGVKGVSYTWSANPAFDGGAVPRTPQITYVPRLTKTLTLVATNPCGSSSASTRVNIPVSDLYYQ